MPSNEVLAKSMGYSTLRKGMVTMEPTRIIPAGYKCHCISICFMCNDKVHSASCLLFRGAYFVNKNVTTPRKHRIHYDCGVQGG